MTTRFKINDQVQMITGKDRGKTGKVMQILRTENLVVVEGLNKMFKHLRANKRGEKGQRVEFAAPVAANKVMFVCAKCGKITRIGMKIEGKKKIRICKKCKAPLE